MFKTKHSKTAEAVQAAGKAGSRFAAMGALAVMGALLVLTLGACGGAPSSPSAASGGASPSASASSTESAAANGTSSAAASNASVASSAQSASANASSAASGAANGSASDTAVKNAKALMMLYPANHMLAGGASDDPSPMSVDMWAQNCLRYADPSSELGMELASSPETAADKAGFNAAAQCVEGTNVVSSDASSVTVEVSLLGTQNTWEDAVEYTMTFVVETNSSGLVTGVSMK